MQKSCKISLHVCVPHYAIKSLKSIIFVLNSEPANICLKNHRVTFPTPSHHRNAGPTHHGRPEKLLCQTFETTEVLLCEGQNDLRQRVKQRSSEAKGHECTTQFLLRQEVLGQTLWFVEIAEEISHDFCLLVVQRKETHQEMQQTTYEYCTLTVIWRDISVLRKRTAESNWRTKSNLEKVYVAYSIVTWNALWPIQKLFALHHFMNRFFWAHPPATCCKEIDLQLTMIAIPRSDFLSKKRLLDGFKLLILIHWHPLVARVAHIPVNLWHVGANHFQVRFKTRDINKTNAWNPNLPKMLLYIIYVDVCS